MSATERERRVLVLPPRARDAEISVSALAQAGLHCEVCTRMSDLVARLPEGAGAVLLTDDALAQEGALAELGAALGDQPAWSELPGVVLLSPDLAPSAVTSVLRSLPNVTLLERPAPTCSLISAVGAAVRARLRQYQVRDLLASEAGARLEAERAVKAKDDFLATVSHELRSPLTALLGWSRLLQNSPEPGVLRQGLEAIERGARAQARLIEDLLDMSRIIAGKLRLELRPVSVSDVIQSTVETLRPTAVAKGLRLEFELEEAPDERDPCVSGDPARLGQIVSHLLNNAIKFTPLGGRVLVTARHTASEVEVRVRDTGQGIHPDFLPHVFERFARAGNPAAHSHGGLGLGLAIVRHLVQLHGGRIWADSLGEGQGATFGVHLPALSVNSPAAPPAHAGNGACVKVNLQHVRVLVVDDDADAGALLGRSLEDFGAQVEVAGSAREALERIEAARPDVLVSDISMPGMDGIEFIREVRSAGRTVPAVAVTALGRSNDRLRALRAGFNQYVSKPVELDELAVIVESLSRRNSARLAAAALNG